MVYDVRNVPIHGLDGARVLLVSEAPGPQEAENGIPLIGSQGGNLYRALLTAGVPWACKFNGGQKFSWPVKGCAVYRNALSAQSNFRLRKQFLCIRERYMACTNAFPHWPKSSHFSRDFVNPRDNDVLGKKNLERLRKECAISDFRLLLLCGEFSYLAFVRQPIKNASRLERTQLHERDLEQINGMLGSHFKLAFYMGHTRRWAMSPQATRRALKKISRLQGWNSSNPKILSNYPRSFHDSN